MKQRILVNGEVVPLDETELPQFEIIQESNTHFQILYNGQTFEVKQLPVSPGSLDSDFLFEINKEKLNVSFQDSPVILTNPSIAPPNSQNLPREMSINAPLPGLILELMVCENQSIKKGDDLFVLEAMKMENLLKASGDGYVKKVHVKAGAKVNKGQLLLELAFEV